MKVNELIEELRKLPPEALVVVKTSQCSIYDCCQVLPIAVASVGRKPTPYWSGKYEVLPDEGAPNAVLIK